MMKQFCERLHKLVVKSSVKEIKPKIVAPLNRAHSCWVGGSTVSSMNTFKLWITKKDFEEDGRIF